MRRPLCLSLLISSPIDVKKERETVEQICHDWNRSAGEEKQVLIEPRRWEKTLNIDSRKKFQELINDQLVIKCDILFAIFGNRIGTPTKDHESGTIEEIEQFINNGKPYFIYFMNNTYSLQDIDVSQVKKLNALKKRFEKNNIGHKTISSLEELGKEFYNDLNYHVNLFQAKELGVQTNQKKVSKKSSTLDESHLAESSGKEKINWYELSISSLINKFLEKSNHQYAFYKRGITFIENCNLWKSLPDTNYDALIELARKAREFAFNKKYGKYDYSKDLRNNYKDWHKLIISTIKDRKLNSNVNVIGVASNNGEELKDIFSNNLFKNIKLNVLDLSENAIEKGKKQFEDIVFYQGDMEGSNLPSATYDIYLNLRSIHSSGVSFTLALSDCYRILKRGGLAIISVSNGYLTPQKPGSNEYFEVRGLYDNRTESFSKHRPFELARKIWSKLVDYGFDEPSIITGKTEIFIVAQKN